MQFSIPQDHPCLPGHFPGQPIVPGVLLLDHVYQAIEARDGPIGPSRLPQVKFMGPLLPGETADVMLDGIAPRWRFRIERSGQLLASGEVVGVR